MFLAFCPNDFMFPVLLLLILLDHIQELGSTNALNCPELDMVLSQVHKVERWKQRCHNIAGTSVGDEKSLLHSLVKVISDILSLNYLFCVYFEVSYNNTS